MSRELSNPEQYSELWTKESEFLELHGIYEKLSHHTPKGNTLEFGCGTGKERAIYQTVAVFYL